MRTPQNILSGPNYGDLRNRTAELVKAWKNSLDSGEMTKLDEFKSPPIVPRGNPNTPGFEERMEKFNREQWERQRLAKAIITEMAKSHHPQALDLSKAGVTTSLGYNFYDLRAPVRLLFPVNTPFRNTIPRIGRRNDGVGTAAHWMANKNIGTVYAGVTEGQRNARGTPDKFDYTATYKELGMERGVSFTAQFAGEGYADNLADEHLRGLFALQLQEEAMILLGNDGNSSGGTGFRLGTCPTPTGAVATTHTVGAAGNLNNQSGADLPYTAALTSSDYVSVACVVLTAMGNPQNGQYGYQAAPTIASGLVPVSTRSNIDGSSDTIFGGMGQISLISTPVNATSGHLTVKFEIPAASLPVKGAFGYAWFVDVQGSNTGSLAGAKLAGITTVPFCYVSGTATGTQVGTATGLNADHSYNALDFSGLLTYCGTTVGAGSYWSDLKGSTLTSEKTGRCTDVETILQYIFDTYQTGVDEIWGASDAIMGLDAAVRWSGTSAAGYQFVTSRDSQNNLLGGYVVSAYQSRFAVNSPTGANAIPIRIHPMIPPGTLYFHIKNNPYPHSRAPYVAGMLVQRDYYSIEWPQVTREWPFGTYVHEVLAHEMPWIPATLTGIGPFVGS